MTTLFAVLVLVGAAQAGAPPLVHTNLVCAVQQAIRHKSPLWTVTECEQAAIAFGLTSNPRLTMAIAVNESDMRPNVVAWHHKGRVADVGLLGVRCKLGPDDRCKNWPVRGLTVEELKDIDTNIAAGEKILQKKKRLLGSRYLHGYSGSTRDRGYTDRITAIMAALSGVEVKSSSPRVRKLISQIVAAVRKLKGH
jgi:hypothetical protein